MPSAHVNILIATVQWLETFVHSAASHNAEVAATVQQLGATLRASEPQGQNVLLELKQLFLAHQETNALLQKAAQDSATPHTETNQCESIQSIVAILERERQAQECAFKSFAAGAFARFFWLLSALTLGRRAEMAAQIKGERLRFVDAMKEATAIHVQSKRNS